MVYFMPWRIIRPCLPIRMLQDWMLFSADIIVYAINDGRICGTDMKSRLI